MPGIDKGGPKAKFCRQRQFDPRQCAPGSFRTKKIKANMRLVICCPKGKFIKNRCQVGTKVQSILKRKKRSGLCPAF